jgi:hypothetical protein
VDWKIDFSHRLEKEMETTKHNELRVKWAPTIRQNEFGPRTPTGRPI